jgi:hypothetical protein
MLSSRHLTTALQRGIHLSVPTVYGIKKVGLRSNF